MPDDGEYRAVAAVVPRRRYFHVVVPLRRTWTSYERFFGSSPASQRSLHPSAFDPLTETGTETLPTIIAWKMQ